jgi:hypothetical protein
MSEIETITTKITIQITHSRPLTEEQVKNLVGNVAEHVRTECRAGLASDGTLGWGFAAIDRFEVSGVHTSGAYAEVALDRAYEEAHR